MVILKHHLHFGTLLHTPLPAGCENALRRYSSQFQHTVDDPLFRMGKLHAALDFGGGSTAVARAGYATAINAHQAFGEHHQPVPRRSGLQVDRSSGWSVPAVTRKFGDAAGAVWRPR